MKPSLQDVGLAVKQLQWSHHRTANRRLRTGAGLSLVQWDVLRHLHREPDASLHDLATATFQTDQSMGELAKRMVDRGLVIRAAGPGRAVRHRLTDEGEAAYRTGSGIVDGVLADSIGILTVSERTSLHAMLTKAASGLGESGRPEDV
ncbi:DNA-binding transcriptional regulator, MarR family [Nakamurella panacisegetis]|uniref:DNA-binding transcriptional regulator, MarR family n=1 Tax=Nakamurella panacisegetis TaxID=1090615 RepID=A0A1H0QN86_9ACTN|nr:MarR family winged helix-turn-helix transcriptional regulator [Nakamurella panacisegetis]SDP18545.1 DNA-binding transcriptional regulator, MarR family [Nakamurella panacisegetis]